MTAAISLDAHRIAVRSAITHDLMHGDVPMIRAVATAEMRTCWCRNRNKAAAMNAAGHMARIIATVRCGACRRVAGDIEPPPRAA